MFKKISAFIIVLCLCSVNAFSADLNGLSAESAILINQKTGEVIFEKNAHHKQSMASTTKIMTALLAVESGMLLNEFTVDKKSIMVEGTSMGLCVGDTVSLLDLTYGMLLPSGNDAANATATYLCGNIEDFIIKMNDKAKSIGMNDTNFVTPSGLDNENHYSTAFDMALLGAYAVNNKQFVDICSKKSAKLNFGNPPYDRWLYNHNKLLSYYDCVLGIKTGFTKKSGRCLVSYAQKDNLGLVAVTLNAPDDWNDHKRMLNFGFESVKTQKESFNIPKTICVVGGESNIALIEDVNYDIQYCKDNNYSFKIFFNDFLYAPVKSGDIAGKIDVYYDEKFIDSLPIKVKNSVSAVIKEKSNGR